MKEFGVKVKELELGNMYSSSTSKIRATTQTFILMNYDEDDYKPFLREDGIYLPIKYTRTISSGSSKVIMTKFENGEEVVSNEFKTSGFKTINFSIEEL